MLVSRTTTRSSRADRDIDEVASAVLIASRALMGVAARSIAAAEEEVTLVQYRALALLTSRGERNASDLADALGVHPSTATRLCDRLVAKGLVHRVTSSASGVSLGEFDASLRRLAPDAVDMNALVELLAHTPLGSTLEAIQARLDEQRAHRRVVELVP